jgi:hypothetical protein
MSRQEGTTLLRLSNVGPLGMNQKPFQIRLGKLLLVSLTSDIFRKRNKKYERISVLFQINITLLVLLLLIPFSRDICWSSADGGAMNF